MQSHKFRVNTWAKRKQTPKDHFHFLMNSTNAQRSFIHELASQQLGNPPSNLWGVPIPTELHAPADTETLHFVMNASKHAPHEFGRLISSHKKASGMISDIVDAVSGGAKTVAKYGMKVGKFAIEHGDTIKKGASILKDLVQTGSTIAHMTGGISDKNKATLDSIAEAMNKHVQGDHYKTTPKKGGYIGRVLI